MANILGFIGIGDTDYPLRAKNQEVVYEALTRYFSEVSEQTRRAVAAFVAGDTSQHSINYALPGGGYMEIGTPEGVPAARKNIGRWDVQLPLFHFMYAFSINRFAAPLMTGQEFATLVESAQNAYVNTTRHMILRAFLKKEAYQVVDDVVGTLNIRPLANGDTTVYPPLIGSDTGTTHDHYLTSGAATISDANNPFALIKQHLQHHFGVGNYAAFINPQESTAAQSLTGFLKVTDPNVKIGGLVNQPVNVPEGLPGKVLGYWEGVWVVEWPYVPAGYTFGLDLNVVPPLLRRIDPPDSGLPSGLTLVTRSDEFPFENSYLVARFGFAPANRLNGVAVQITANATYTTPSQFSEL